jgi:hypothetical protein
MEDLLFQRSKHITTIYELYLVYLGKTGKIWMKHRTQLPATVIKNGTVDGNQGTIVLFKTVIMNIPLRCFSARTNKQKCIHSSTTSPKWPEQ